MFQYTEAALRSRDTVVETDVKQGSEKETPPPTADSSGFMNRSLTKMLSKIAPPPGSGEKQLQDKCRQLLRELDVTETSVTANTRRLNICRTELLFEINKAAKEIEEIESGRTALLKEGLSRFSIAQDLCHEKQNESALHMQAQSLVFAPGDDLKTLLREVDRLTAVVTSLQSKQHTHALHLRKESNPPAKDSPHGLASNSMTSDDEATGFPSPAHSGGGSEQQQPGEFNELFAQAEKLGEAMESFRQLAVRATNTLLEVSEAERNYAKLSSRLAERHGFMSSGSGGAAASRHVSAASSQFTPQHTLSSKDSTPANEVLSQFEGPQLKSGFEVFVKCYTATSEVHQRTAEVFSDEVCQRLDLIQKRVELGRRDLADKLSVNSKRFEAQQSYHEKINSKLVKLQALLKERRQTLKSARDSTGGDNSGTSSNTTSAFTVGTIPSIADLERESESESEDNNNLTSPTVSVTAPSTNLSFSSVATAVMAGNAPESDKTTRRSSAKMMQGLESFSSSLRNGKLKLAVGLEQAADRVNRIEKQISSLEEEERDVLESLKASQVTLNTAHGLVQTELSGVLAASKDLILSELEAMRGAVDALVSWGVEAEGIGKTANQTLHLSLDAIDLSSDLTHFVSLVSKPVDASIAFSADSLLDIPAVEVFEPQRSELIEEERRAYANGGTAAAPSLHLPSLAESAAETANNNATREAPDSDDEEEDEEETPSNRGSPFVVVDGGADNASSSRKPSLTSPDSTSKPSSRKNSETPSLSAPPLTVMESVSVVETSSVGVTAHSITTTTTAVETHQVSSVAAVAAPVVAVTAESTVAPSTPPKSKSAPAVAPPSTPEPTNVNSNNNAGSQSPMPAPLSSPPATTSNSTSLLSPSGGNSSKYQEPQVLGELSKFGLSGADKVLESFSCALYPKKGLLTHGRLFITQHFLAFSGWPDTRVLLPLSSIKNLEKCNTMVYIPNAISITVEEGEEYFFGSFIDRVQCFTLLTNLSEIAKRIISIQGNAFQPETRVLEFGYQSCYNPFGVVESAAAAGGATTSPNNALEMVSLQNNGEVSSPSTADSLVGIALNESASSKSNDNNNNGGLTTSSGHKEVPEYIPSPNSPLLNESTTKTTTIRKKKIRAPPAPRPVPAVEAFFSPEVKDGVNLSTLYADKGITPMLERTFDFSVPDLWRCYFLRGEGYGDFLLSEGDLNIETGEWSAFPTARPQPEDIAKLNFSHSRPFAYAHPRTTMLMFGPKNAPATQIQYLYLPHDVSSGGGGEALSAVRPKRGLVLNITQFDGIPMADVFKVMQYWMFETHPTDPTKCIVKVGLAMHYIKGSLFKSQIFGGTKDELTDQLKKWFVFAERRGRDYVQHSLSQQQQSVLEDNLITEDTYPSEDEYEEEEEVVTTTTTNNATNTTTVQSQVRRRSISTAHSVQSEHNQSSGNLLAAGHVAATPRSSLTGSQTSRENAYQQQQQQHQQSQYQQQHQSQVAPVPPPTAVNKTALLALGVAFLVLLLLQFSQHRALTSQMRTLSSQMAASQKASEAHMATQSDVIERLLKQLAKGK
eukprot:gene23821-30092_t